MTKLGMKPVTDIVRVTFKKSKNFMLYIDDPEVMKSPGAENTYIIFGEAKINDLAGALGQKEAQQYANPEKAVGKEAAEKTEKAEEKPTVEEVETGPLDETGLDAAAIESVMSGASVTRNQAIKALRETGGDSVDAIIVRIYFVISWANVNFFLLRNSPSKLSAQCNEWYRAYHKCIQVFL